MELLSANLEIRNWQEIKDNIDSILERVGYNYINISDIKLGELVLLMSYILFPPSLSLSLSMDTQIYDIYIKYIDVLNKLKINPTKNILTKTWHWRIGIDQYIIELLIQKILINNQLIGHVIKIHNKEKWDKVKEAILYLQVLNIILKRNNSDTFCHLEKLILNNVK